MRSIRIVSVILILAALCCSFISCGIGDEDIVLPTRDFYDMTVSFQIMDGNGRKLFDAKDYNYKGHEEPTILNIISDYLTIVEESRCTIDKNNTLQQIGGVKAKSGQYWAFMEGIDQDVQAILQNSGLQSKHLIDQKMSEYMISDGGEFTIVLVTTN